MKVYIFMLAILSSCFAQDFHGEIEFTQTQKGRQTFDAIAVLDFGSLSLLNRYLNVEGGNNRGEFALGRSWQAIDRPKFQLTVVPYAGLTTDGAVFTPVICGFKVFGRQGHYFPDPKVYFTDRSTRHHTLYQEASVGINHSGTWQARWERLSIAGKLTAFNRFGVERRLFVRDSRHFQLSPFLDTAHRELGFYAGYRW